MQLGVHIGQQNMTMNEIRSIWRRFDADRIDAYLTETVPAVRAATA